MGMLLLNTISVANETIRSSHISVIIKSIIVYNKPLQGWPRWLHRSYPGRLLPADTSPMWLEEKNGLGVPASELQRWLSRTATTTGCAGPLVGSDRVLESCNLKTSKMGVNHHRCWWGRVVLDKPITKLWHWSFRSLVPIYVYRALHDHIVYSLLSGFRDEREWAPVNPGSPHGLQLVNPSSSRPLWPSNLPQKSREIVRLMVKG